jgi:two-component system, chemotaxis family, protein-glutamate methylesterase/glutaminase
MQENKVFLLPGELCVSREPVEMATLLGSCVAICLFNRRGNFGGMNHYMLARTPTGSSACGKHGDYSSGLLIKTMLSYDPNPGNLQAYVLGGGNVNGHLNVGTGIGLANIQLAFEMLQAEKIQIAGKEIGGDNGRKVYFKNWTGEVETRIIEKSEHTKVIEEKRKDISGRQIKVLIVDDSQTVRNILTEALSIDPAIDVVGGAANPYEARELMLEYDPDVICLDIIMPKMDGITFLKKLFQYKPKPVIIISTVAQRGSKLRQQAQAIGAVDVIDKEELELYKGMDVVRAVLIGKVKAASAVWVKKKTEEELSAI